MKTSSFAPPSKLDPTALAPTRVDGISAVVTMHNGAAWIGPCLDSILGQDWPGRLEVVIVDDASTDDSCRIVEARSDSRIRLIALAENVGVSEARNRGIDEARYDWIAFNDQDDVWLPDKLSRQVALLDAHPVASGAVGGNGRLHSDNRSQWGFRLGPLRWIPQEIPHLHDPPYFDARQDGHVYVQSLLVRSDVASSVRFRRGMRLMEDQVFLMSLAERCRLVCVSDPVFLYRLGYQNTTAPGRMQAREFHANRAYIEAVLASRARGLPDPVADTFIRNYEVSPIDVERFELSQGFRKVNTDWVNHGLGRAVLSLLAMTSRRPIATSQYFVARIVHWWSSSDRLVTASPSGQRATIIGYLVPEFPAQTHTFFWRETRALADLGIETRFVSTRRPPTRTIPHRWAPDAMARTHYLVPGSLVDGWNALRLLVRTGPTHLASIVSSLTCEPGRSPRTLLDAVVTLIMAAKVAQLARREGWSHLHVGSCGRSATIAAVASQLHTGLSYSLSMLGPDFSTYGSNHQVKWRTARFGLFQSRQLQAQGQQILGAAMPRHIALAPVGVDVDVMRRKWPYSPWVHGQRCRLYSCGRLNAVKGHEFVIDALKLVRNAGIDAHLEIAGEDEQGGSGFRRRIEQHIRSAGLQEHVTLLGAVSEEQNWDRYAQAHVYVMGSLNEAAGAVAAMEAMAMEVPVIMTNSGATSELIADGRDGLLVRPGDSTEIAKALIRLLRDPALACTLGQAGRLAVVKRYSHRVSAEAIARLLAETALQPADAGAEAGRPGAGNQDAVSVAGSK